MCFTKFVITCYYNVCNRVSYYYTTSKEVLAMTSNNLRYAQLLEDRRHNLATEQTAADVAAESKRHDVASEAQQYAELSETRRYNSGRLAQSANELFETSRSNRAREDETNRSNLAKETEAERSNRAREEETKRKNTLDAFETARHDKEVEQETARSNLANERIRNSQAGANWWKAVSDSVLGVSREAREWLGRGKWAGLGAFN